MAGHRGLLSDVDVLVVGAGPTGLVTALQAHDHGASVRVVERRPRAFRPSRAMVVHPRTLEALRPLGVTEALLDRTDGDPRAELHLGRRTLSVRLSDLGLPDSPFPHPALVRQADVEDVLAQALERRGVAVERGTELVTHHADEDGAQVRLRRDGPDEQARCRFLVGCDGSTSTVRRGARVEFAGAGHAEEVVLADVDLATTLTSDRLHVTVGRHGLAFLFPLGENGAPWRLLATRPARAGGEPPTRVEDDELDRLVAGAGLPAVVTRCAWSSVVPLQHRVASTFREGPVFLAGDAAHTSSPAAAQGMNTGLVDGLNLGWKLALAAGHDAAEPLLASYGDERRPVARQVVALTRLVLFAEASTSPVAELGRAHFATGLVPLLPHLLGRRRLSATVAAVLSQRWVRYRHSVLSLDDTPYAAGPRPGDRLPDREVLVDGRTRSLHELTARPGIHVLLDRDASAPSRTGQHVVLHRLDDAPGCGVVAVRPDGHVGYRSARGDLTGLDRWLDLVNGLDRTTTRTRSDARAVARTRAPGTNDPPARASPRMDWTSRGHDGHRPGSSQRP
ncbi:FAD-dependent monooxygenase [Phycicoccus sp. Soil748]|uniref:FAD-dependent monooxygenase n=1 Tax=Phycicoccus sp. Soil748 TaxID=1736397 RepID=UPI000A5F0F01|nr:FAD-dependent monooxygenase [Phycicoccus sp. Soil748]